MNDAIRKIADAVLYEGYLLYPYRANSVKNRQRWNFGVLYPRKYADAQTGADRWSLRAECIVTGAPDVDVLLRFIQLTPRPDSTWQEATAREVSLPGELAFGEIAGWSDVRTEAVAEGVWKVTVDVENRTAYDGDPEDRDAALLRSFASAHLVLTARGGAFVSLLDPPAGLADAVAACRSEGVYPVLVGDDSMLASPIILYDQPKIAPESRGDLFDGTEIDEILSLRIMTLTEDEKREASASDERARRLIERTDALTADDLFAMHGTMRNDPSVNVGGVTLRAGDRVRLRPRRGGDIMDVVLAGKIATIDAIEQDFENRLHLAVLIDDDPGRDLGALKQPGHRFFFSPEEVEPL
jgi:hypothetical protein